MSFLHRIDLLLHMFTARDDFEFPCGRVDRALWRMP